MNPASFFRLAMTLAVAAVAGPVLATDAVVGSGAPASCTQVAFDTALSSVQSSGGGTIAFNCGGTHSIIFSSQRLITSQVIVDGGGLVTLSGGNANRIFFVNPGARLELRNITLSNGYVATGNGGAIASLGSLHLDNAAFRNNHTSTEGGSGGAIVSEGPMIVVDSLFENNSAANGGAVYLRFGAGLGTFTNTTFRGNKALSAVNGWGGAILLWDGAQLTVRGCDFDSNVARRGGAIHNQFANVGLVVEQGTLVRNNSASESGGALWLKAGTTLIEESVIASNRAEASGGAIFNDGGTLTITDSSIALNSASLNGGGLWIRDGITSITGTTLVGNAATYHPMGDESGGGIFLLGSAGTQLSLLNSTLSGNTAGIGSGGAIWARAFSGSMAIDLRQVTIADNVAFRGSALEIQPEAAAIALTLVNTALSGNSTPTCSIATSIRSAAIARYSLWSDTSCSFGTSEQNQANTQAALGPLADNGGWTDTHMPLPESPLIDSGICLPGVTTDQRGASRPHGPACDIGAVEAGALANGNTVFADGFEATDVVAASGWETR
jgi:hypothetical protein